MEKESPMLKQLLLSDIIVPKNRRTPMKGRVATLARSFREIGQLNPILVNADGNKLIAGRTRYEAAKQMGWKDIFCNVVEYDALHARLAEIDENLEREDLPALEMVQALA